MTKRRLRLLQCAIFVCATAGFAAPAMYGVRPFADPISVVAAIIAILSAPYSVVRRAISRSDDVYAAVALTGGAALILGGVVLPDSVLARILGVLGVLLIAPGITGPCRISDSADGSAADRFRFSSSE